MRCTGHRMAAVAGLALWLLPALARAHDEGLRQPESALYDARADRYLVSNIGGDPRAKDGDGSITIVQPEGGTGARTWIRGGRDGVELHAPKGLALYREWLVVADIDALRFFDRTSGAPVRTLAIEGAVFLNDVCVTADGTFFVSDSDAGRIYRVAPDGSPAIFYEAPDFERPNGLATAPDGIIAVNFGAPRILHIDWEGRARALPAPPAGNLDGVVRLPDGSLAVTSWEASAVFRIGPDGASSILASELRGPADLGFDERRGRLLVPELLADRLTTVSTRKPVCDADNAGLALPPGFCAMEVAAELGAVRNLVVAPNGDVFAALSARRGGLGGVLALRDLDGDGRADLRRRFGEGDGHGIALGPAHLFYAAPDQIVRWAWEAGQLEPTGEAEVIVAGFPAQREHRAKAIALGSQGELYVEVGAPSNSCQRSNRESRSPGLDPCLQLEHHAGIWRYGAEDSNRQHDPAQRFATGMRHALALAVHPATGELWAAINGRDQLGGLWGYDAARNAELPAEELVRVTEGADFGWPYCYYDGPKSRKVLAPEYGGDGSEPGRCAAKANPVLAFPAHWAPMALSFYTGSAFPARYREGAFLAFRGSWNRAPLPQQGFRVVFVPFKGGAPERSTSPGFETFATAAGDPTAFRFTGVAVGPDGSLYLSADANGKIWRVMPAPSPAAWVR